jgi:HEPN domain-containing protein
MSGPDPADTREEVVGWLRVATADRRVARLCLDADPPARDGAAFHCQQAAEKVLKGFLVQAGIDFRKTHDLDLLGRTVLTRFPSLEPLVLPLRDWTNWSVAYRYPGEPDVVPQPSVMELDRALDLIARLASELEAIAL